MLDPQARFLPNVNPSNPGKMVNFIESPNVLDLYQDQFAPYHNQYDITFKEPFNGTLFRLPLRTADQAESSLLSKRSLSPAEALELMESLKVEASAMLLFLKSVENIEIKYWAEDADEAVTMFRCGISNISSDLRSKRSFVGDAEKSISSNENNSLLKILTADYTLNISCRSLIDSTIDYNSYIEIWEVCNQMGGYSANIIAKDPNNLLLRLVPWGGVASCISGKSIASNADSCKSIVSNDDITGRSNQGGLAYCFLPLPVQTGLPIMVNGFFELSSNRRDVWQAGPDMTGDGKTRAEWNLSLIRDIISPSYVRLLIRLRNTLGFTSIFQKMWPSCKLASPWSLLATCTLNGCREEKLLFSDVQDMNEVTKGKILSKLSSNSNKASGSWITCIDAILLPNDLSEIHTKNLTEFLINANQQLSLCDNYLRNLLIESKTCTKIAYPKFVRSSLRDCTKITNKVANISVVSNEYTYKPNPDMCGFLLYYCLSDYKLENFSYLEDLDLLSILPLENSSTGLLRIYNSQQAQAITDTSIMGFSPLQAIWSLSQCKFNVHDACELLTANQEKVMLNINQDSSVLSDINSLYIVVGENESKVFEDASSILLDRNIIGVKEMEFLLHPNMNLLSNIRKFQPNLVPDLLRFILPNELLSGSIVSKSSLSQKIFDKISIFLTHFWKFSSFKPDVISSVAQGFSIVPSLDLETFLPLSRMSNLIVERNGDNVLPENIKNILKKLNVYIVDPSALSDNGSMPSVYWQYVNSPSRTGILSCLELVSRNNLNKFELLSSENKEDLRLHLATCEPVKNLTEIECGIIRKLPVFINYSEEKYINIGTRIEKFENKNSNMPLLSALKDTSRLAVSLFPEYYLIYRTPQDLQLLNKLGVKILKRCEYFKFELLANVDILHHKNSQDVENNILIMLTELKALMDDDWYFLTHLKTIKFVPSSISKKNSTLNIPEDEMRSTLFLPNELFDPHIVEFQSLLDDTFFPIISFQQEDILVFLRSIGLRSVLDWDGVLSCAKSVSIMSEESEDECNQKSIRGSSLLSFLDKNILKLLGEEENDKDQSKSSFSMFSFRSLFGESGSQSKISDLTVLEELKLIEWIPVLTKRRNLCMPWPEEEKISVVSNIINTRHVKDDWLCSATKRLQVDNITQSRLLEVFGWLSEFDVSTIAFQLRELAKNFLLLKENNINNKVNDNSLSNDEIFNFQDSREKITSIIPQLYQRLNSASDENKIEITSLLESCNWIWVGDTFVSPDSVAITASVNAAPYLFQLPQDYHVYSKLLSLFRVKKGFSPRDYIQVLREMAEDTGAIQNINKLNEKQSLPLSDTNIDIAVSIVTLLSIDCGDISSHSVYLPDSSGRLVLSTELVNDDVPWMAGPEYASIRVGCQLIHPNISSLVANKMGVKSLRLSLVNKSLEQTLFSSPQESLEAFGQAESLTSRLKTILDMYPDGNPIFSELIQNADDSGATKVSIMLDMNTYPSESLLDSKMSPLQGPSLIVCNNSMFTEADYHALARIGQGSKLEKLAATGRFGLGFSSTYHITDTPTFVSGEHMVIFDPHCSFAPGATLIQPGLRIRCQGNSLRSTFPDQFIPFEFFGCDFNTPYNGTIFRFPLRTAALARRSEISKRSYSIEDLEDNIEQLVGQLSQHLLFLRSVRCIEIYHCDKGSKTPTLLHRAQSSIHEMQTKNDQTLIRFFDKVQASNKSSPPSRDQFYQKLLSTPDAKLPSFSFKLHVIVESYKEQVYDSSVLNDNQPLVTQGIEVTPQSKNNSIKLSVAKQVINKKTSVLQNNEEFLFLIVSGIRGGEAKRLASDNSMRHLKLVPLGSVASCIFRSQGCQQSEPLIHDIFPDITGQAFCYLPLPIQTQLPVHTNAYWELSSNRRDIWKGDDTKGVAKLRSEWNIHAMNDILAPLYKELLILSFKLCVDKNNTAIVNGKSIITIAGHQVLFSPHDLLSLLPCPKPLDPWHNISSNLFSRIKDETLLYSNINGGQYIALKDAILLESVENKDDKDEINIRRRLELLLIKENLNIVFVPSVILKSLIDNKCVIGEVTSELVRNHFSTSKNKNKSIKNHPCLTPNDLSKESIQESLSNAYFILQYCFKDINKSLYESLHYLPILPMENGSLGQILPVSEPFLYLANEVERKLLFRAGDKIVASDQLLGSVVASCLHDPLFYEVCNVKSITSVDMLKLICSFIPEEWVSTDTTLVLRDNNGLISLSDEWLTGIWSYILDGQILSLFEGVFPLLPILQSQNMKRGKYLVKISSERPVLHMSFKDIPTSAASAFSDIGLYIFDAEVLGGISYSQEISNLLTHPTVRGFLDALSSVSDQIPEGSKKWSIETRCALMEYLLDSILNKIDEITSQDISILCSLPIWQRNGSESPLSLESFTLLNLEEDQLPPRNIDSSLLGSKFIKIRNDRDRALYSMLNIKEPLKASFFYNYLIPRALIKDGSVTHDKRLTSLQIDNLAIEILKNLVLLEEEHPGFTEHIKSIPIFKNSNSVLCAPKNLFDPQGNQLQELLPKYLFPSKELSESSLLLPLRSLGLNSKLNCNGILVCCQSIEHDLNNSTLSAAEKEFRTKQAIQRATSLTKFLDLNLESLLNEIDPDGLASYLSNDNENDKDNLIETEDKLNNKSKLISSLGGSWSTQLRSTIWVPVVTNPPSRSSEGLPWPVKVHASPLAAPSQCAHNSNVWSCSSTHRICSVEIKTDLLKFILGWKAPIRGRFAAIQLLNIVDFYSKISSDKKDRLQEEFNQVIPKVFYSLHVALEIENKNDVDIWLKLLKGKAVIWIGGRFVEGSRIAFQSLSNSINTEPFLFVVTGEMIEYKKILTNLGVRDTFEAIDLSNMMRDLYLSYNTNPLPPANLEISVGILKLLVTLIIGEDIRNSGDENIDETNETDNHSIDSDDDSDNEQVDVDLKDINIQDESEEEGKKEITNIMKLPAKTPISIEDLGDIYMPDKFSVLCQASTLSYDDAPWISSALELNKNSASGIKFTHDKFLCEEAKILGAKSLREQLFSGDEVVCPDAKALNLLLKNGNVEDNVKDTIDDLLALSNLLGGTSFHIIFDERNHPIESLMHPGLAKTQGPSLIVYIEGVVIDSENIAQNMAPPQFLPSMPDDQDSIGDISKAKQLYPTSGKRLLSAFAITDCLQIISGKEFYIFDPCGQYLINQHSDEHVNSNKNDVNSNRQHAQRCNLIGGKQDIISRFPDQFISFMSLPFSLRASLEGQGKLNGLLIRMPLRTHVSSSISSNITSIDTLKNSLSNFKNNLEGSLLFSSTLVNASCMHWGLKENIESNQEGEFSHNQCEVDYELRLSALSISKRDQRWDLIKDKGWKKSTILSLFSKPFAPVTLAYQLSISTKIYKSIESNKNSISNKIGWLDWELPEDVITSSINNDLIEDITNWSIHSTNGTGKIRDLAVEDPYRLLKLQPFLTIAFKILSDTSNITEPPMSGLYYCSGGAVGISGLPLHIEGPFLQDCKKRIIPFSSSDYSVDKIENKSLKFRRSQVDYVLNSKDIFNWNTALVTTALENLYPIGFNKLTSEIASKSNIPSKEGLYIYWPFYPRISDSTLKIVKRSNILKILSTLPVYLTRKGFAGLDACVLPMYPLSTQVITYLQTVMPLALTPTQISIDFKLNKIKFDSLTPAILRSYLRKDAAGQCTRLRNKYEIVIPLLILALSDLKKSSEEGDFIRKKSFKEITGTPLLPMADGTICVFPQSARDHVAFAPLSLHALLPNLHKIFLHPTVLKNIEITSDPLFMESNFISKFSISFLQENIEHVIPSNWKKCDAIEWVTESKKSVVGKGISLGSPTVPNSPPSELLMYVLWKEVLGSEPISLFNGFRSWPMIPVISKGRRLLLAGSLLPYLFSLVSTAVQDDRRSHFYRESGRISSLVEAEALDRTKRSDEGKASNNWNWTSENQFKITIESEAPPTIAPISSVAVANNIEIPDDIIENYNENEGNIIVNDDENQNNEVVEENILDGGLNSIPLTLLASMQKLGIPFLDGNIFDGHPEVLQSYVANLSSGKRLLECIYYINKENIRIYSYNSEDILIDEGFIFSFDCLTPTERSEILVDIYKSHCRNEFSNFELAKLKSLKLFTSRNNNEAIAIEDCLGGVFWCENDSVLEGISLSNDMSLSSSSNSSTSNIVPIILINDPFLREIYNLVGVEELTASAAVRRFTLPSLQSMESDSERLEIMLSLSRRWGLYREDENLINLLKDVQFIPNWDSGQSNIIINGKTRMPREIFSWTNDDLLDSLSGSSQSLYFPPPDLRSPELHVMFKDLGMLSELDKPSLLRIVKDIEKSYVENGSFETNKEVIDRGRSILRYIKENDRCDSIPFDPDLSKKLGKIKFVPIQTPTAVSMGGHIEWKNEVGRFDQLVCRSSGALAFTIMPVLDEDISPPLYYYSSLGITTAPNKDIVLKHLHNLISTSDCLDRWNNPYFSLRMTFSSIFEFLFDHWKDIPISMKNSMKNMNIIPVGHSLIKPGRLFFRLSEDLSPFMHEIPRYFGTHETFLKLVGVRETPSASDYISFLESLFIECNGNILNPNELRAVVSIVMFISSKQELINNDGINSSNAKTLIKSNQLYVPDENSILRESSLILSKDDGWLRDRVGESVCKEGFFFLHPSITSSIASLLNIPKLSDVLIEKLSDNWDESLSTQYTRESEVKILKDLHSRISNAILSNELIEALASLSVVAKSNQNSTIPIQSSASIEEEGFELILSKILKLRICFVHSLSTKLIIKDPRKLSKVIILDQIISDTETVSSSSSSRNISEFPTLQYIKYNDKEGDDINNEFDKTLYINTKMLVHPISAEIAVSLGLCKLLDLPFSLSTPLSCLIEAAASSSLNSIPHVLSTLRIGTDVKTLKERLRGIPGEKVISEDLPLLELKPFRTFIQSEMIAYEDKSNTSIQLCMRYGKIIEISETKDDTGLKKVLVKTCGNPAINMLTTEIYSFKSGRNQALSNSLSKNSSKVIESHILGLKSSDKLSVPIPIENNSQINSNKQDLEGIVKNDLLEALNGLLSRAGIPVGLDTKELMTKIIDLDGKNKRLENDLQNER
jgi:hypothetical protein